MKHVLLMVSLALAATTAFAGEMPADWATLSSRVQSMCRGYYPERDWQQALADLSAFEDRAAAAAQWNSAVEARVLRAAVVGDARGDHAAAAELLKDAMKRYDSHQPPAMRQAYLQLARAYSRLGDEDEVERVIVRYKSSPYYDPEQYPYSGGKGPADPLTVVRPSAGAGDSLTVTALEVQRRQATFAPGRGFPDFRLTDRQGRTWTLDDFRGKVLLVDVWSRAWTPWERDLPTLKALYDRHHLAGFEILGVSLNPVGSETVAYADQQRLTWPLVVGDPTLPRHLGLYGECANFLVDGNGVIIAHNLRGGELVEAVKKALGRGP